MIEKSALCGRETAMLCAFLLSVECLFYLYATVVTG